MGRRYALLLRKADTALVDVVASYCDTMPKLAAWFEENIPAGLAVLTLPEHHRERLRPSPRSARSGLNNAISVFPGRPSPRIERPVQQERKRRTVSLCAGFGRA